MFPHLFASLDGLRGAFEKANGSPTTPVFDLGQNELGDAKRPPVARAARFRGCDAEGRVGVHGLRLPRRAERRLSTDRRSRLTMRQRNCGMRALATGIDAP
jgi:hypothetical protein